MSSPRAPVISETDNSRDFFFTLMEGEKYFESDGSDETTEAGRKRGPEVGTACSSACFRSFSGSR